MHMRMRSSVVLAGLSALSMLAFTQGCGSGSSSADNSSADVSTVENTSVKQQVVGTCWIYTTAGWAEALHLKATGEKSDISEAYWLYWHLWSMITNGEVAESGVIEEGGHWGTAAELASRYGVLEESDFLPIEGTGKLKDRDLDAMNAIMVELAVTSLKDEAARKDGAKVRSALNAAFNLQPETIAWMDAVFGKDGGKDFGPGGGALASENAPVVPAASYRVAGPSGAPAKLTLKEAIGRDLPESNPNRRTGFQTWTYAAQPMSRALERRIQKALHQGLPVPIAFWVDEKAKTAEGSFKEPSETPEKFEHHLALLTDYEISNLPEFGTLKAGQEETRNEALAAAIASESGVDFLRIKNSWGASPRMNSSIPPGYYDLFSKYLSASVNVCNGSACAAKNIVTYVILPPGV
jgi:hypothetical protein